MAGFLPHPKAAIVNDVSDNEIEDGVFINSRFYIPHPEDKGKSVVRFKPEDLMFVSSISDRSVPMILKQISSNIPRCKFVIPGQHYDEGAVAVTQKTRNKVDKNAVCCTECNEPQSLPMARHFLLNNRPCDEQLKCPYCTFIAPSVCSRQAHIRVHQVSSPFVCPECGKDFDSSQSLHDHMRDVCFHLAKRVKYKCPAPKCRKLFMQRTTLASHLFVHFEVYYYCTLCKINFLKVEEINEHTGKHGNEGDSLKMQFRCAVCNAHFLESKKHIETHTLGAEVCVYVYSCRWCKGNFRTPSTYDEHRKRCSKRFDDNYKIQVFNNEERSPKHYFSVCLKCSSKEVVHFNVHYGEKCKSCQERLRIVPVEQVVVLDVVGSSSLRCVSTCLLCKTVFPTDELILHARKCKFINPVVKISAYDQFKVENFKRTPSEGRSIKKRRSNVCSDSDLEADAPIPFDGTYRCRFCDYTHKDRTEFHNHIKSHKNVSTAYQCMECGDCFVVKLSLTRHLMHFHKILNVDAYFEENQCFDKAAIVEIVKENQCSVCLQQFTDGRELSNHFRKHGMAFLMCNMK